jgi:hypothetical protein
VPIKDIRNTWSDSKDIFKRSFSLEALEELLGGSVDGRQVCRGHSLLVLDQRLEDGLHADGAVGDEDDVAGLEEVRRHLVEILKKKLFSLLLKE